MDRTTLLACFLDDEALLSDITTRMLARVPREIDAMQAARGALDLAAMQTLAHSLKGSLGVFGPSQAYDAVLRVESISQGGDVSAVVQELDALFDVLEQWMVELRRLVPEASDSTTSRGE